MFTLGIAGGSGSGKSTVVEQLLQQEFAKSIAHLPHDAYYKNRRDMPEAVASLNNWDHPDALDTALYLKHIDWLKAGRSIARPNYDFEKHARTEEITTIEPKPILLLEGILLFHILPLRERIDLRVYVETPADRRILRRVLRDVRERGRTVESIVEQYESTVRPMHAIFVEPSKSFAHVVIPWEEHNPTAVELLSTKIREQLTHLTIEG
jgi:uridine kinase